MNLREAVSLIRLLHPSTLILLAANMLPLAGILFCGWDAFVLLMLYWMETAIIGFWMLVRVATADTASIGEFKSQRRDRGIDCRLRREDLQSRRGHVHHSG